MYTVANVQPPPVRVIDNSAVLTAQLAKLKQVKGTRDSARAAKALDGVRAAAADSSINLLGARLLASRVAACFFFFCFLRRRLTQPCRRMH
jgi:methylmalonyl-CoA mutase N-terminal domain/subunit